MTLSNNDEKERVLNERILNISMLITNKYPELLKYIGEMPVTIPNESEPEITLKNLQDYFASLCLIVHNYKLEHQSLNKE